MKPQAVPRIRPDKRRGPDGCRVSIGHPTAQDTLDALCVSDQTDRASVVETLVAFHFALQELGLEGHTEPGV